RELRTDVEHRQLLVPVARDFLRRVTEQHVDDVRRAERLPGPIHARQQFASGFGAIPGRGRDEAVVAVATRLAARFAEVRQERPPAALRRLAPAEQRVELAALA